MDRYTVNTAKSQIGFIDVIAAPTFEVVKNFVPIFAEYFGNLENNKNIWKSKIDFFEEELSTHNYRFRIFNFLIREIKRNEIVENGKEHHLTVGKHFGYFLFVKISDLYA